MESDGKHMAPGPEAGSREDAKINRNSEQPQSAASVVGLQAEQPVFEQTSRWRSRTARQEAAVLLVVALAVAGWFLFRSPGEEPSHPPRVDSASQTNTSITLSPLLICTGVNPDGIPTGVSDTYSQAQLQKTGAMAFINVSGVIPGRTVFQFRRTSGGASYASPAHAFERDPDSIRVSLGKDLQPGQHLIEFLIDGTVRRSASISVEGSSQKPSGRTSRPKRAHQPPVLEMDIAVNAPSEEPAPSSRAAAEHEPAPGKTDRDGEERGEAPKPVPAPVIRHSAAKHWHNFGSCTGELRLTPQTVEFTSAQHTLKFGIHDVELDGDGILDPSGKSWHFFIQGTNVQRLLGKWKNGDLFAPPSALAPDASRKNKGRAYPTRHKHRIGSCSGELMLTPEAVEFSSDQHYIKTYIGNTQIEADGILDRTGRRWQFEIQGEDAGALLRAWKEGTLFR